MKILTWNIQATQGCDGNYDKNRTIERIKNFGDLDVICLQEVARNIPSLNANDQLALIAKQFTGFEVIWAPGFSVPDAAGIRCEFGNLTLVKKPLLKNARTHILASPAVGEVQMTRTMAEVIVDAGERGIAIFNTHLAFHSMLEQVAQLNDLTHLRDQIISKINKTNDARASGPYIYADSAEGVLLCGDLNIDSDSDEFKTHIINEQWYDCWDMQIRHENLERQPTCGCFDSVQWPQGPHVRDYFLATEATARKTTNVTVDVETDASDHQPVLLDIDL
ncbi:MAG: endonuclease/exonuclease/phosphatase family protein [Granulosicoccaceae bacterium]